MKLLRHLTPDGPAYAALQSDGSLRAIEGDVFGYFRPTERIVQRGAALPPVAPTLIIGIGLNYALHAGESGRALPKVPMWFVKLPGSAQAHGGPIRLPRQQPSTKVDFEGELAVVLGREARNVPRDRAFDYILGYTCGNDVSARDWQREFGGGQFSHAKSFDTFCPLGPVLVTKDEVPSPNALRLRTLLNGAVMQDASTADMLFEVPALVEFLSADKTLPAGTVILTGTPEGVGFARTPPVWLQPGDTLSVEIERIGTLSNPVV